MTDHNPLATALWEADRHLATLESALQDWHAAPPANLLELETDPETLRILDQLLFRFSKLQDTLGLRLVPATLAALSEPFEDWPMIDRLNRLEKLGFIDVDNWLGWREIRNRLAHEYPEQPETRFAAIESAIAAAADLAAAYRAWRAKLKPSPCSDKSSDE
ncbi:hypothetical protein [uncultured Lamprocystis sp.]|jgi:hypothetical protein|uniref:hypothetical protein n=1 Tax=uncultured Lamprocystis sp. TaxID=543132 RepID=UPI0025DE9637|nr:hypothetical protein [uncultured Lamprocystis sp.]